jgi:hypothetical protein
VRVIGVLLILEVIGLVLLGGYEFLQVDWRDIDLRTPRPQAVELAVFALFIPSAILTLLSALSFLFLYRRGWLLAAIAQGFQPGYVYPIMAYCVLMILYLNSQDVRMVFRTGQQASHEN